MQFSDYTKFSRNLLKNDQDIDQGKFLTNWKARFFQIGFIFAKFNWCVFERFSLNISTKTFDQKS
jgi:hypothetical protein